MSRAPDVARGLPAPLVEAARAWLAADPDPGTRRELADLLEAGDRAELEDRFAGALTFGTAGLRGRVGAGPNRMNRAVVLRTTRGLADHLHSQEGAAEQGVVVGFDARRDSERFALDAVGVLAAAGLQVHWFPTPQPTPLVAYAQRTLRAVAAVVVTASHNPPEDNGYKVYGLGAAQIVPPVDGQIAAAIEAVGPADGVPRVDPEGHELVTPVPAEIVDRYLDELRSARPADVGPTLSVAYTPLHGVGGALVRRAFEDAGGVELHVTPSQAEPDGAFPTVRFPNPEEPGALDAVLATAREVGADLVIANDPDADRLAVAVPDRAAPEGYRPLTGNQIGVLLADHLLRSRAVDRPLVVSSIVSTPMIHDVAAAHGARSEVTLTGFKWICAACRTLEQDDQRTFVLGFEEALGTSVGPVVRDKDGIGAAVAFAGLARRLVAEGEDVLSRWAELCREHGLWVSHQHSVTAAGVAGRRRIDAAMEAAAAGPAPALAGRRVGAVTDYRIGADQRPPWLGAHDLVELALEDGRAMIRPSGTEPKCKLYVDLRAPLADDEDLDARTRQLTDEAAAIARELATAVGLEGE